MEVLYIVKATYSDGTVVEDTVTNPNFTSVGSVKRHCEAEAGSDLVAIDIHDCRNDRKIWK